MRVAAALGLPFSVKARGADISHFGHAPATRTQLLAAAAKAADPDAIIADRRRKEEEERLRVEENERRKLLGEDDRPDEELTPQERLDRMIRQAAANIERAEAAAAKEAEGKKDEL